MSWYRKSQEESYSVSGLIVTCFGKGYESKLKKYNLEIDEKFDGDPWVASAKSSSDSSMSCKKLNELISDYQSDPDNKNVPYYFIAKNSSGDEYVIFNDDGELVPINSNEEKIKAKDIGIKKGLVSDQVDF